MPLDIKNMVRGAEVFTCDDIVDMIKEHTKSAYDAYIPNCGREGKGKSHTSIQLLLRYLKIPYDSPEALTVIESNVRYAEQCSVNKALDFYVNEAKDGNCYIFDEAERMCSKYDSTSPESRTIRHYYAISRKRRIVSILNMPMLANFDIYMRSGRAFLALVAVSRWIEMGRGISVVLFADDDSPDAFDLENYYKRKRKSSKSFYQLGAMDKIKLWSKCKSFAGVLETEALPPHLEAKYFELANRGQQYKSILEDIKQESLFNKLYSKGGRIYGAQAF